MVRTSSGKGPSAVELKAKEKEEAEAFAKAPKLEDGRADVKAGLNGIYGNADLARGRDGKKKAFMQYREVIGDCLREGYTVRQVWDYMTGIGVIRVSYSSFSSYAKAEFGPVGRLQSVAAPEPSSAEVVELAGSEGREVDERVRELVGKSAGKPAGKPSEKPAADPHAGIKFGAGAGKKPFDPSGG